MKQRLMLLILSFLIFAFILEGTVYAYEREEHDDHIEYVLFGDGEYKE